MSSAGFSSASDFFAIKNPVVIEDMTLGGAESKKLFYNEVVSIKLNLPQNHPGKEVLIKNIYEEALKQLIDDSTPH